MNRFTVFEYAAHVTGSWKHAGRLGLLSKLTRPIVAASTRSGTLRDMGDRIISAWTRAEAGEIFSERIVRLRKYRGRLPADFKFDRESLSERGNAE